MKTKFTPLVTLRKRGVDEAELSLQQIAAAIVAKQGEIDTLVSELACLASPTSSEHGGFLAYDNYKNFYRAKIDKAMCELAEFRAKKRELQEQFRLRNIELEKAKFLEQNEVQKYIKKLKKQEENDMNEVSMMLFANKGARDV